MSLHIHAADIFNMTRTSSLLRNVLSNWLVLALGIAYAFVITPIVVRSLGIERYGIWSFLNGLLAYSELLYLGLGSAVIKHVAQYRARNDVAGINRLASVVASIYTVLGLISLATLIGISRFVPGMFAEPLSPDSANAAIITCMLLGLRLLMVFLTSAFAGLLSGYDRYDLVNAVNLFNVALRFVATPVLLQVGWNPLLVLAWLGVAVGVIDFIALTIVGFWTVDGLAVRPARPRAEELRSLYGFGLQSFFIVFAVKLISYTDTTVIGVMLGAASVALYSLPLQLVEFARMFVGGFTAVMLPRVTISSTQGDQRAIRDAYLRSARIGFFFTGWLGGGLITLGPMFLGLWIGPSVGDVSPSVLLFLVLALMGQVLSSQVPLAFYQGLGLLAVPAIVIAAEGVLNLALSIWLAPSLGLRGVALATAVAAIVSVVVLPAYLCRKLQIPIRLLFDSIAPGAAMIVALLVIQTAVAFALPSVSWLALILRISITAPVAVAIITSMFPDEERRAILRLVSWPKSRQTDTRPPTYSALRRIKQAGIARAPDSLLGAVLLVLERFRPEITSRSPLVMCCVTPGGGAVTIPAPYVLEIATGPTAPAGWIDTLRSAGVRVTDSTWRSTFAGDAAASAAVLTDAAGSAIGTAGTTPLSAADGVALLTWVGIHAEHQGRGLAKPLVTAALHAAAANGMKTVFLLTDDHRLPAIRTYLSTGFRPCPHSWDWMQRPRWRRIARQLGMTLEACDRDSHTQWAGKVPDEVDPATDVRRVAIETVARESRDLQSPSELGGFSPPSDSELEQLFRQKYGSLAETGWSPRQRHRFQYFLPADMYEALLTRLIVPGCEWLDVGGGHHIFPENSKLSRTLADRASVVVAVDPSDNVLRNPYAHERERCLLEDYRTERLFDVATLRMVAEHVVDPPRLVRALHALVRPSGVVVIFTVNGRSPLTLLSGAIPYQLHHPIKQVFWGGAEEDTFPVAYKMNSKAVLKRILEENGFQEVAFWYLDDLSALGRFRIGGYLELVAWRTLRTLGLRYPENCLLGVYRRSAEDPS